MKSFVVGRSLQSDILLSDDSVSQRHAQIIVEDGLAVIRDLMSSNGTFVNGIRVESQSLKDGDSIHFGEFHALFKNGSLVDGDSKSLLKALLVYQETKKSLSVNRKLGAVGVAILALAFVVTFKLISSSAGPSTLAIEDIARATVYIEVLDSLGEVCWSGSGVSVVDGLHIITNAHVAAVSAEDGPEYEDCKTLSIGVTDSSSRRPTNFIEASIIEIDTSLDLALLKLDLVESKKLPTLQLNYVELGLDESIRVVGYPGVGGDTITLTNGVISGIDNSSSAKFYKVSAKISHGNSGGPVVNQAGELIGIATAGFAADVDCPTQDTCTVLDESIGLVRPIKFAQSFIEKINK
jgi:S1-C subfamily serine protease